MGFGFGFQQKSVVQQGWNRPSEWLPISNLIDLNNEQKAVMLYHIKDDIDYDSISFSVTASTSGTVTIDWGDGTVDTNVANGTYTHNYDYASITPYLTEDGYKQCIVIVTSSSNITNMSFYNRVNSQGEYSIGFVDGVFSLPWLAKTSHMFYNCYALQSLAIGDFSSSTDTSYMFYNCYALQSLAIGDFSTCTNTSRMFAACYALQSLAIGDFSSSTDTSYMFAYMRNLQSLAIGDFSSSTDTSYMFRDTSNLQSLTLSKYNNDIYIYSTGLSKTKLINLFNDLETVTDKTVTITGTRGASGLSDTDKAIATDKGWTLVV